MSDVVLDAKNLVAGIDGNALHQPISFKLTARSRLAVTGPSGSGKTTLLRAIAGLSDPLEGALALRGQTPEQLSWPTYRRRVVLVAQQPVLLDADVRANLERPFTYRVNHVDFPAEEAEALLDSVGLGGRFEQNARSLSVGQQQRLCVVRALLVDPDVVLLDEPTSALDPESVGQLEEVVRRRCDERGLAVLVVSHNPDQIARWCDESLTLDVP